MIPGKRLTFILKLGLSVLLIWLLVSQIDISTVGATLRQLAPGLAVLALTIIFLQVVPAVFRWIAVLNSIGGSLSPMRGCRIYFIGAFFNQTLPSSMGGDAIRIYFAHRFGMSLRAAVNGVLLERIVTVVALILLVLALLPIVPLPAEKAGMPLFWTVLFSFAFIVAAALIFLLVLGKIVSRWRHLKIMRGLRALSDDARKVFLAPRPLLKTVLWAVIGHVTVSFAVYAMARGLRIDVGLLECQLLMPLANMVAMLPVSIAGWGMREGAMVVLFGLVGVVPENALALSILYGLTVMVSGIPGGILWLISGAARRDAMAELNVS